MLGFILFDKHNIMIKHLLASALLLASGIANAQNIIYTDTLGIGPESVPEFSPSNQVSKPAYAGGWAFGVNNDPNNITGLAQAYNVNNPGNAYAILALFAGKTKGSEGVPNTKATFQIRPVIDGGAFVIQAGQFVPTFGPAAPVASKDYFFDEMDTTLATLNLITLDQPVNIPYQRVAVSVDFRALKTAGDKIGILSDAPGNGLNLFYTFHQVTQGDTSFYIPSNFLFQNQLNVNIGLFLVFGEPDTGVGIEEIKFENGVRAKLFPNPVRETATLEIEADRNFKNTELMIMDMNGRLVHRQQVGNVPEGKLQLIIDTDRLQSGQYIYSFGNDDVRFSRVFQVVK